MVELRKRPARDEAPAPPAKKKSSIAGKAKGAAEKVKQKVTGGATATDGAKRDVPKGAPAVGTTLNLEDLGGEVQTQEGKAVTLKTLVDESKAGVVIFTYPKASTPGCTKQACLFRDAYDPITAVGLSIYGLSADSPKSNTTFKTKQSLQYPLLCDPAQTLIGAIGMKKPPKSTTRGVFVVDKAGVVKASEAGGPAATVDVVRRVVGEMDDAEKIEEESKAKTDAA